MPISFVSVSKQMDLPIQIYDTFNLKKLKSPKSRFILRLRLPTLHFFGQQPTWWGRGLAVIWYSN
jgi:hypothetical protein